MQIEIVTKDKRKICGNTYDDVVKVLKKGSYSEENTKQYMKSVRKRTKIYHGEKIRYRNSMEFLHELLRIGEIISITEVIG